jgi:hypothetical protein
LLTLPPFFLFWIGSEEPKIPTEHRIIPDAQLHEPKGIIAAALNTVYKALGGGTGAWVKLAESDIDYSVKANNRFGWNDISDSQYTSGAPRAVAAATRTQLTNNGLATQSDSTRLGVIWATNQFNINDLNAVYSVRLAYKVTAAAAASTPYSILTEFQSDTGSLVVASKTEFVKGGGIVNHIGGDFPIYIGSAINNAPLKIFITADTAINIHDIGFVVSRTYVEK